MRKVPINAGNRRPLFSQLNHSAFDSVRDRVIVPFVWVMAGVIAMNLNGNVRGTPSDLPSECSLDTDRIPEQTPTGQDDGEFQRILQGQGLTKDYTKQLAGLLSDERYVEAQDLGKQLLQAAKLSKNASDLRCLARLFAWRDAFWRLHPKGGPEAANPRSKSMNDVARELLDSIDLRGVPPVFEKMAREAFDSAAQLEPSAPETWVVRALFEYESGCLEISLASLLRAYELDATSDPETHGWWRTLVCALSSGLSERLTP